MRRWCVPLARSAHSPPCFLSYRCSPICIAPAVVRRRRSPCVFGFTSTRGVVPLGKHLNRNKRRNPRQIETAEIIKFQGSKFDHERNLPPIKALTPTQADYLDALRASPQIVVLGPAGTGKTWIAATY